MNRELVVNKNEFQSGNPSIKFYYEQDGIKCSGFIVLCEGVYYAYHNQCMHLPVELDWKDNHFLDDDGKFIICATHGATYNIHDGLCVYGPCKGKKLNKMLIEETVDQLIIIIRAS